MPVSSVQYAQVPWAYINGLGISNDATTPNTSLDVSPGSTMDYTSKYQITLPSAVVLNATSNGVNGLDTGSLAANTMYAIYIIGDSVNANPTGVLLSLATFIAPPILPFGYTVFNFIGFAPTDASSHFYKGIWTIGNDDHRLFMYDAPQATAVTAGNATTYTTVDLAPLVPGYPSNNFFGYTPSPRDVYINTSFLPGAASRVLNIHPGTGTGDALVVTGQVASVAITNQSLVFASYATTDPRIQYKVSNSGDAAAINVAGFGWYV